MSNLDRSPAVEQFNISEEILQKLQQLNAVQTEITLHSPNDDSLTTNDRLILVPPDSDKKGNDYTGMIITSQRRFYVSPSSPEEDISSLFQDGDQLKETWSSIFQQETGDSYLRADENWAAWTTINGKQIQLNITRVTENRGDSMGELSSELSKRIENRANTQTEAKPKNPFKTRPSSNN